MIQQNRAADESGFVVRDLGVEAYDGVLEAMRDFTLGRDADTPDELWVLQHEAVFTLGQAGKREHILDAHDIPVVQSDRGGQVTYHGPGQLIVYLLSDLRRSQLKVRQLVDAIEQSIIATLAVYGIEGSTRERAPGVYVDGRKIAALGLRIKRGCSYHGLSFNIDMELAPFSYINPCGYEGLETTQLRDLLSQPGEQLFSAAREVLMRELLRNLV